ncbi:hypothetical protein MYAER_4012 [Microcystis aeruginosa NIES-2549]|uniref:Uncharacterized protein n=1 Tax=Microcystis aeruginosa NIES-2549 TaxID=1641812 RepID=A0A0F6RNP7_MICAE|nr:hypothetical protein MYAER_4012 [Microcystis aeruginosa NIES-2549]AOC54746.1 hypothetical protein amyaer_4057 [Microcystis aeruginosa NIES-2481]
MANIRTSLGIIGRVSVNQLPGKLGKSLGLYYIRKMPNNFPETFRQNFWFLLAQIEPIPAQPLTI